MSQRGFPGTVLLTLTASLFLWGCRGDQTDVVGPDDVVPRFAKPDCTVDASHPSCDSGGGLTTATMDVAGGMEITGAPAVIEQDNDTKLTTFADGDVDLHYKLAITSADILAGNVCRIVRGKNVTEAEALDVAAALAAEIDDDVQSASRLAATADWSDDTGGLNTKYTSDLGPVRVRITSSSNFPENGAPSVNRTFDDGTTTPGGVMSADCCKSKTA